MAIPDSSSIMTPLLQLAGDGVERSITEAVSSLAVTFGLTGQDLMKFPRNGRYSVFSTQVRKAVRDLVRVGLLERTRIEYFVITEQGKESLEKLAQIPDYL